MSKDGSDIQRRRTTSMSKDGSDIQRRTRRTRTTSMSKDGSDIQRPKTTLMSKGECGGPILACVLEGIAARWLSAHYKDIARHSARYGSGSWVCNPMS